jgi:hypothetical protein
MHKKVLSTLFVTGLIVSGCLGGIKDLAFKEAPSSDERYWKKSVRVIGKKIKQKRKMESDRLFCTDPMDRAEQLLIQEYIEANGNNKFYRDSVMWLVRDRANKILDRDKENSLAASSKYEKKMGW